MRPCCNRRGCLPCLAALVAGILLAMLLPPWLCFVIIMAVLVCLCLLDWEVCWVKIMVVKAPKMFRGLLRKVFGIGGEE